MVERGQNFGFALEARESFRIARQRRRQDLDRYLPVQFGVFGAIHLAHAAHAQQREDFVMTDFVASRERHMRVSVQFTRSESG
jgi:hypothetical protein